MNRIYVAGPISAPSLLEALNNIREGQRASIAVLKAGFSPFSPFLDFLYQLQEPLTIDQYYGYSSAWLEKADAVLVIGDWARSTGVKREIRRAAELGIPIFFDLEVMCKKLNER